MDDVKQKLVKAGFKGEIDDSDKALEFASHERRCSKLSLNLWCDRKPPRTLKKLVALVAEQKQTRI